MKIEGRRSEDGLSYEIVQGERVIQSYLIAEALNDRKLESAIKRNKWQPIAGG